MPFSARARWHRASAIGVSVLLLALGPAGAPASADPPSSAQPGPNSWRPPPVNMGSLPPDFGPHGKPEDNTNFTTGNNGGCITSGVGNVQIVDRPPAQSMLNIEAAQQIAKGSGVTVAVIDTGVNPHPYLTTGNRLENGGDYILNDGNGTLDCDGHGTIVAGIIAADAPNTVAFKGVAPQARILAIKQTSSVYTDQVNNNRTAGDLQTLAEAIMFAADRPDVKVITMSVDDCMLADAESLTLNLTSARSLQAAIHYAVNTKDKVVISAAGNMPSSDKNTDQNGQQTSACQNAQQNSLPNPNQVNQVQAPPVYADDVLSVASVSPQTGSVSAFSVWGPWVSIAAPGEEITSVDPGANGTGLSNRTVEKGQSVSMQGTSFAAPYVAGVTALIRSRFPNLSARQVMYRLEATAQHPSGPTGRNNQVGYGIIDPVAALTATIPGQNGIPDARSTRIRAQLPAMPYRDPTPMRVALIGTAAGVLALLGTLFVVRTRRQNRERRGPVTQRP